MDRKAIEPYRMTAEKEAKLWKEAIVVLDSSVLLDLYLLPKVARNKVYDEIFKNLKDRLWLPFHVQFEYLKNREKSIKNPIGENYDKLKTKVGKIGGVIKSDIVKRLEEISRETKKDDKHPHLEQKKIEAFKKDADAFLIKHKGFEEEILKEIKSVEDEILSIEKADDVLEALEKHFKIGREFTFDEIIEITKEGKHRYEYKIPPGYGDYYKEEKKGTQIFGDLIIWKEILEFSKKSQKSIILITNDITKDEDWCYLDKKSGESRIYAPREELIKEIKDHSNVDFWMYNLPQFLYQANENLESSFEDETIQTIAQFVNTKPEKGDYLKFSCNRCKRIHRYPEEDFDLDFTCVGGSERSMGTENQHQAEEVFSCQCGNEILATFEVWEYPVGAHNNDSVELDNAKLLESFYFTVDFFDNEERFCDCHHCTGNKDGMGNLVYFGMRSNLVNEYDVSHKNHNYKFVISGDCDWCSELHFECAKCHSENSSIEKNTTIECKGGCGLKYNIVCNTDNDGVSEDEVHLIDDRLVDCSKCGEKFVDQDGTEICNDCEKEYNDK